MQERWLAVEDRVLKMRQAERTEMKKRTSYPVHYQYQSELVSIRRKDFFPLWQAKRLLLDVIPTLSHESDGLIFQVCSADPKEESITQVLQSCMPSWSENLW